MSGVLVLLVVGFVTESPCWWPSAAYFSDWRDPLDPRNHGTRRRRTQALLL